MSNNWPEQQFAYPMRNGTGWSMVELWGAGEELPFAVVVEHTWANERIGSDPFWAGCLAQYRSFGVFSRKVGSPVFSPGFCGQQPGLRPPSSYPFWSWGPFALLFTPDSTETKKRRESAACLIMIFSYSLLIQSVSIRSIIDWSRPIFSARFDHFSPN